MSKKLDKIKTPAIKGTFLKTSKTYDVNTEKVSFSFENFNTDSVINTRITYNSYYQNIESSRNAVSDFFKVMKEFSKFKIGELMSDRGLKDAFHINLIDRDDHINRIEYVLKDNYRYPDKKIEQFEREYYEFQISDGKRVICHKLDNVICPLFIDCNHMICVDSSRDVKMKMVYKVKSSFSHLSETDLSEKDKEIIDFVKMIIDDYELDKTISSDGIVELLKDIVNNNQI